MSKINGAQFKAFWTDKNPQFWPDGRYVDDDVLIVNGSEVDSDFDYGNLRDDDNIKIESGFVFEENGDEVCSLRALFSKWSKAQTTKRFCVECDISTFEAVHAAIVAAGGKVS